MKKTLHIDERLLREARATTRCVERLHGDHRLFDLLDAALERTFDGEAQETAGALGARERRAREDPIELCAHALGSMRDVP